MFQPWAGHVWPADVTYTGYARNMSSIEVRNYGLGGRNYGLWMANYGL